MSDQEATQLASEISEALAGADGGTVLLVLVDLEAVWYTRCHP